MTRMLTRSSLFCVLVGLAGCKHGKPEEIHIVEQRVSPTGSFAAIIAASAQTHTFEVDRLNSEGRIEWRHPINCSTVNGVDVAGEVIVMRCATSDADHIEALSAEDGKELWHYEEKVENTRIAGHVAILGDAVVAYGDDRLTVLAAQDGKLRLTYPSDLGEPWFASGHAVGINDGKLVDIDLHTGSQSATPAAGEGCLAGELYLEHNGSKITVRSVAAIQAAPSTLIEGLPVGADRLHACGTYESDLILEFTTDAPNAALHLIRADRTGKVTFDLKIDGVRTEDRMELGLPNGALPRWLIVAMRDDKSSHFAKIDLEEGKLVARRAEHLDATAMFLDRGDWLVTTPNTLVRYAGATGKLIPSLQFVSQRPVKRITAATSGGGHFWVFGDAWTTRDAIDLLVLDDQFRPTSSRGITLGSAK